jgi:glycosyltransferase involved in cell wall biosynthesis
VIEPEPSIAFLVKRFPRLSETFVLNEFLELRRQGLPVRLIAIMDPAEPHVQPEADALRGEVTYLRGPRFWPLLPRVIRVAARHRLGTLRALRWVVPRARLASWRRLAEALILVDELEGQPVHLHVHWAHAPGGVALLAERIAGIPWSLSTHAKDLYTVPAADVAERARCAHFITTCTSANVEHLTEVIGAAPEKVVLCRHGVRLDRFAALNRVPEPGRLLSIGRLVPKKGFDVLIGACAELARRNVEFRLDIVGDGAQRQALLGLVERLGLSDRVKILPGRPQPELLDFYARAACFVMAPAVQSDGDRDGVPNVILEAMACGVPTVATAISGIPEVIEDGRTGVLVPSGDRDALADALQLLLAVPERAQQLGDAGRRVVHSEFELADCTAPVVELLRLRLGLRLPPHAREPAAAPA